MLEGWNQVEVGFGDETANFGPRQEYGSLLHQVDTKATISHTGEVTQNPQVCGVANDDNVAVAADNHVTLLGEDESKYMGTKCFDAQIDAMALSGDGHFLVAADRLGFIHFIHYDTGKELFEKRLVIDVEDEGGGQVFSHMTFVSKTKKDLSKVIIVNHSCVYILKNVNTAELHKALVDDQKVRIKALQDQMTVDVMETNLHHTERVLYVTPGDNEDIITVGAGEFSVCLWTTDDDEYLAVRSLPASANGDMIVKKCSVISCGNLLCLNTKGLLSVINLELFVLLYDLPYETVTDFSVLETGDENNDNLDNTKLVLLSLDSGGNTRLDICTLSTIEPIYSLVLHPSTILVQATSFQESIYIVEGVPNEDNSQLISSLRVRYLTETVPETKLAHLIRKERFDKAEDFAKMFGLDLELVYKAKANNLIMLLSLLNAKKMEPEKIQTGLKDLYQCLEQIKDDEIVAQCCIMTILPTYQDMFELLKFAKDRLMKSSSNTKGCGMKGGELLTKIGQLIYFLETLQLTTGQNAFSAELWCDFLRADLLSEVLSNLQNGNIQEAVIILNRHQADIAKGFDETKLEEVLDTLPEDLCSAELIYFLEDFTPFVLQHLPQAMPTVATWVEQRARNMEIFEKDGWPANALKLCKLFLHKWTSMTSDGDLFTSNNNMLDFDKPAMNCNTARSACKHLRNLIHQLEQLLRLKTKYNCKLSLARFVQETKESVAYRLLDCVADGELISFAMEKYVRPYLTEYRLDEDQTLFNYIQDVLNTLYARNVFRRHTGWEAKIIAIIRYIEDLSFRLEAIFCTAKNIPLPWSNELDSLIKEGSATDHPKATEIKNLCLLAELDKICMKYILERCVIRDKRNAEKLIHYIIREDRPSAMDDALQVSEIIGLKNTDVYMERLHFLIEHNQVDEIVSVLKMLSNKDVLECGQRMLVFVKILLDDRVDLSEEHKEVNNREAMAYVRGICYILGHLLGIGLDFMNGNLENDLRLLTLIKLLQDEFHLFLTYTQAGDETFKKTLLKTYINDYIISDKKAVTLAPKEFPSERKPPKYGFTQSKIFRLGDILGIKPVIVRSHIAIDAARKGNVQMALQNAKELYNNLPDEETATLMYEICKILCRHLSAELSSEPKSLAVKNLHLDLQTMAQLAVAHCPRSMINECLQLSHSLIKGDDVLANCQTGIYDLVVQEVDGVSDKTGFGAWCSEGYYQEEGLVMDSHIAGPLVYKDCVLASAGSLAPPLSEDRFQVTGQLIEYLLQNDHKQLALSYLFDVISSSLVYPLPLTDSSQPNQVNGHSEAVKCLIEDFVSQSKQLIVNISRKALSQSHLDYELIQGYLLSVDHKRRLDMLMKAAKNVDQQYDKAMAIGNLGTTFASEMIGETHILKMWQSYKKNAAWAIRLGSLKVPRKDLFKKDRNSKIAVVSKLLSNKEVTIDLIHAFCSDYDLVFEDALFHHVEELLLPPSSDAIDSSVTISEDELEKTEKIMTVVLNIVNRLKEYATLGKKLANIFKKVDVYDYERITCVLTALQSINSTEEIELGLKLVKALKLYKRVSPPGEFEINYRNPDKEALKQRRLSPLAQHRLPFQPLLCEDAWKILSPELNEKTFDLLLPICNLLKLSPEILCMVAVKNLVNDYNKRRRTADEADVKSAAVDKTRCRWKLDKDSEENFFPTVRSLISRMPASKKAAITVNWIVINLPLGAEKVAGLKLAVDFLKKWTAVCTDKPEVADQVGKMYEKFQTFYKQLSIEQILMLNNLGDKNLLVLSNQPASLIGKLYEHESIQERFKPGVILDNLPDIHKVTADIGQLCGIKVDHIQAKLLDKWLPATSEPNLDSTLNMTCTSLDVTMRSHEEETAQDEINLRRVCYLIQCDSMKSSILYLLSYFRRKDLSTVCYVRVIRCLLMVDEELVQSFLPQPTDFRKLLKTYVYLAKLEQLNMMQSVESFTKCNKDGLIRAIWLNHSHNQQAVCLVCDLCLDYQITDVQLWSSVLHKLLAFNLIGYLRYVMLRMTSNPQLWHLASYDKIWNKLILIPLTSVTCPLDEEAAEECLMSYKLIHRCPLIYCLDLQGIARQFVKVGLPTCAVGCSLLIVSRDVRSQELKTLLQHEDNIQTILSQLREWSKAGRMIPLRDQIEAAVYDFIRDADLYHILEDTGFEESFARHIILQGDINGLLAFLLKQSRFNEAAILVTTYQMLLGASIQEEVESEIDKIRVYLELNQLAELLEYLPPVTSDSGDDGDASAADDDEDYSCDRRRDDDEFNCTSAILCNQ